MTKIFLAPIAETDETVTLRRTDFDAMVEAMEDAADRDTVDRIDRAVAAGETEYLPLEMCKRLLAGEHPVRVWREHRALTQVRLAELAGIDRVYLTEIEGGKKPGSVAALNALAKAMNVTIDDLVRDADG